MKKHDAEKNIVIAGGGTAGWICALISKYYFPKSSVTLIESSSIGIIGAGEGSTPILINMLSQIGINTEDLIKNTSSTIKNGNKFVNFNLDKDFYYVFNEVFNPFENKDADYVYELMAYKNGLEEIDYGILERASDLNKIRPNLDELGYAVHIDGRSFSKYLSELGKERGVISIDAKISSVNLNENKFVNSITLDSGQTVDVDFIFDCTGFKKLIVGETYGTEWIDFSETLPVNAALPFMIPMGEVIPPYTQVIAMDYGWSWKIPLQHRYGCGYVFDSDYITEEEAKSEIERMLGFIPDYQKLIRFKPGVFRETLINNCVAIGLSSAFVEPMEATSISRSMNMLSDIIDLLWKNDFELSDEQRYKFNQEVVEEMLDTADFIYLHYMTKKDHTPFWRDFYKNNKVPKTLKVKIDLLNKFKNKEYKRIAFGPYGYYRILKGLDMIDLEYLNKWYDQNDLASLQAEFDIYRKQHMADIDKYLDHTEFIRGIASEV